MHVRPLIRLLHLRLLSTQRPSSTSAHHLRRPPPPQPDHSPRHPPTQSTPSRLSALTPTRPDEVTTILKMVEADASNVEAGLDRLGLDFSDDHLLAKVMEAVNARRIPSLRFFTWARQKTSVSPEVYNLVINNLGLLGDFSAMLELLIELSKVGHCVTVKALAFLSMYGSDSAGVKQAAERVVETLVGAGGSCRSSGVYSLIKVLCDFNHFDSAMFVMEMTARKTAYYKIFVAAKCKKRCFQDAWKLFDEMREYGCEPTVKPYNYLLGSLCKNGLIEEGCRLLEIMEALGYLPDAITFEVLAVHACKVGRLEFALEFLGRMLEVGVQPRTSTHAVFIKSYFLSGREGCAHEYVHSMSEKDKWTSCGNYSLLAKLFHESGRLQEAYKVIMEMMGKGLLPNFNVYVKVLKDTHKKMGGKATSELKQKYVYLWSTFRKS